MTYFLTSIAFFWLVNIGCVDCTHIEASNIASDDVTN